MPSPSLLIEVTTDADLLADVHFRTTSVAYRSMFPAGSRPPTRADLLRSWEERLSDRSTTAFAALNGGRVVGAVAVRDDPDFDGEGQLTGLHVLPTEWGQGVGSALHDVALVQLASQSFERAGLWVIAANGRARYMYEARNWVLVEGVKVSKHGITEVRYGRSLDDVDCG